LHRGRPGGAQSAVAAALAAVRWQLCACRPGAHARPLQRPRQGCARAARLHHRGRLAGVGGARLGGAQALQQAPLRARVRRLLRGRARRERLDLPARAPARGRASCAAGAVCGSGLQARGCPEKYRAHEGGTTSSAAKHVRA